MKFSISLTLSFIYKIDGIYFYNSAAVSFC